MGGCVAKTPIVDLFCVNDLKCFPLVLIIFFTFESFNFALNDISSVFSAFCCMGVRG